MSKGNSTLPSSSSESQSSGRQSRRWKPGLERRSITRTTRLGRADWEGCSVLALLLIAGGLLQATPSTQATKPAVAQTAPISGKDVDDSAMLLKVKRIYVESFGDDIISKELQSMIVS